MPIILKNADLLGSVGIDDLLDLPTMDESLSAFSFDLETVDDLTLDDSDVLDVPWLNKEPFDLSNYVFNHDCMWNGHCGSKDHPNDDFTKPCIKTLLSPVTETQTSKQPRSTPAGRSVLLKAAAKVPVLNSPESPPMSDDEDSKKYTPFSLIDYALKECNMDEDSDLCEYFGDDDNIICEEKEPRQKINYSCEIDHSYYHKDKYSSVNPVNNFGLETPSDSGTFFFCVNILFSLPNKR